MRPKHLFLAACVAVAVVGFRAAFCLAVQYPLGTDSLLSEPFGLEQVTVLRTHLDIDLEIAESVRSTYLLRGNGAPKVVELTMPVGNGARVRDIRLDGTSVPFEQKGYVPRSLPNYWRPVTTTPDISGQGRLPYQSDKEFTVTRCRFTLTPGEHWLTIIMQPNPGYLLGSTAVGEVCNYQFAYNLSPANGRKDRGELAVSIRLPRVSAVAVDPPLERMGTKLSGEIVGIWPNAVAITWRLPQVDERSEARTWSLFLAPVVLVALSALALGAWHLLRRQRRPMAKGAGP